MRSHRHSVTVLMLSIGLSACFGATHGRPLNWDSASDLRPDEAVRVYTAEDRLTLRAVRVTADSLSGIPWRASLECTSCRVAIARPAIDSVTKVPTDLSGAVNGVLIFGTIAGLLVWGMADTGGD